MRAHAVVLVAGEATEALMNTNRSAIVASVEHARGIRSMALVAERLPLVAAGLYFPFPLTHRGQGQIAQGDGLHFSAVEERDGRPAQFLGRTRRWLFCWSRQGIAVVMKGVAIQADDDGPVGKLGVP
jgi:hypothetical protein